jgi:hypothetical protein
MFDVLQKILDRGDLAHLAFFIFALAGWSAFLMAFRELQAANRRFDLFVRELALFNDRFYGD